MTYKRHGPTKRGSMKISSCWRGRVLSVGKFSVQQWTGGEDCQAVVLLVRASAILFGFASSLSLCGWSTTARPRRPRCYWARFAAFFALHVLLPANGALKNVSNWFSRSWGVFGCVRGVWWTGIPFDCGCVISGTRRDVKLGGTSEQRRNISSLLLK